MDIINRIIKRNKEKVMAIDPISGIGPQSISNEMSLLIIQDRDKDDEDDNLLLYAYQVQISQKGFEAYENGFIQSSGNDSFMAYNSSGQMTSSLGSSSSSSSSSSGE